MPVPPPAKCHPGWMPPLASYQSSSHYWASSIFHTLAVWRQCQIISDKSHPCPYVKEHHYNCNNRYLRESDGLADDLLHPPRAFCSPQSSSSLEWLDASSSRGSSETSLSDDSPPARCLLRAPPTSASKHMHHQSTTSISHQHRLGQWPSGNSVGQINVSPDSIETDDHSYRTSWYATSHSA